MILNAIKTSRKVQIETSTTIAKGLDWIDGGLAISLEKYRAINE